MARVTTSPRRIQSPGIQITESELRPTSQVITDRPTALIAGFANQGPTEEMVRVRNLSQFVNVYGTPTNDAERYFYYGVRDLVTAGGPIDIYTTRIPYGSGYGEGYADEYSALFFPVLHNKPTYSESTEYRILPPKSILISNQKYEEIQEGYTNWSSTLSSSQNTSFVEAGSSYAISYATLTSIAVNQNISVNTLSSVSLATSSVFVLSSVFLDSFLRPSVENFSVYNGSNAAFLLSTANITNVYQLTGGVSLGYSYWNNLSSSLEFDSVDDRGYAGIIAINADKTGVNELFEGFYLGLMDNSDDSPDTNFQEIRSIYTVTSAGNSLQTFTEIPSSRLAFTLTQDFSSVDRASISEQVARFPGYDFSDDSFNDSLKLMVFRLNKSLYNQDTITLSYATRESYVGSLYVNRTQNNPNGGPATNFSLENRVNRNGNSKIDLLINPAISNSQDWIDINGRPIKTVRMADTAKALYSFGRYAPYYQNIQKVIGYVPGKLEQVFKLFDTNENENLDIDVSVEAGLGSIYVGSQQRYRDYNFDPNQQIFDDSYPVKMDTLKLKPKERVLIENGNLLRDEYQEVANKFRAFANQKKNHVFIADPLRYIFVNGNKPTNSRKAYIYATDIFRPLATQFEGIASSYMAVYANWFKVIDNVFANEFVWLPPSTKAAKQFLSTARINQPWTAPAGFNYGLISRGGADSLAINPTQRQRDMLYRSSFNPIAYFPADGTAIFGQKTFLRRPSAFDRLNVRLLFLHLEKQTVQTLRPFVFEPNTDLTRQRVVASLTPLFENARINEGLIDYKIICDERNNTPQSIDNNELRVAIYIQPVRTAEFILVDFIATSSGVDLDELFEN
jgi:hypothetical protein